MCDETAERWYPPTHASGTPANAGLGRDFFGVLAPEGH